jgi:hypothetical protein
MRADADLVVWTVDLSGNGARVGLDVAATAGFTGDGWSLSVPELGQFPVTRLWHRGSTYGLGFDISEEERTRLAAALATRFPRRG